MIIHEICLFIIFHSDSNCGDKNAEIIQKNYCLLSEMLNVESCGLIEALYADGVIQTDEKLDLQAESRPSLRCEQLLALLIRKNSDQFDQFLSALDRTGHHHVAGIVRGRIGEKTVSTVSNESSVIDNGVTEPTGQQVEQSVLDRSRNLGCTAADGCGE